MTPLNIGDRHEVFGDDYLIDTEKTTCANSGAAPHRTAIIPPCNNQPVRLRFKLRQTKLYSM